MSMNTKIKAEIFDGGIELTGMPRFSVEKSFDCGQCFRFDPDADGRIAGVAGGCYAAFEQPQSGTLRIYGADADSWERVWRGFLDLDTDYDSIDLDIIDARPDDAVIREAIGCGSGIRIFRQDPWEAICSFIISQNNNIPRIKKLIAALCSRFGEPIGDGIFAFPTPESLAAATVEQIAELKTGFRAAYISDAARRIAGGELDLDMISSADTATAAAELMKIRGVGPKVSACALLFGFGKTDAFPIDVWVRRVLDEYYPAGTNASDFGRYAGVAQQYLFYYRRWGGGAS